MQPVTMVGIMDTHVRTMILAAVLGWMASSCTTEEPQVPPPSPLKPVPEVKEAEPSPRDPGWVKQLNLPLDPGNESALGVPIPKGFEPREPEKGAFRFEGNVAFDKTLDFYRRLLKTLYIEERKPNDWYFDQAGIKVGEIKDPVLVRVRRNVPDSTEILVSLAVKHPEPEVPPPTASNAPEAPKPAAERSISNWEKIGNRFSLGKDGKKVPYNKNDPIYY